MRKQYAHVLADTPGVAGANVFWSIFNPVGSGRIVYIEKVHIEGYAVAATAVLVSLLGTRTTAHSGGTLIAQSAIALLAAFNEAATAVVRQVAVTVTAGNDVFAAAPPTMTAATALQVPVVRDFLDPARAVVLQEGEGFCIRQTGTGSTAHNYSISVQWREDAPKSLEDQDLI